jgi:glycosyltransferase involved in cell wall biosynthesis
MFQSFELIIADGGSSDDSAARAIASGDPRISGLRLEHSGSPAGTRNAALRHARGRYVAFLDSDDAWLLFLPRVLARYRRHEGNLSRDQLAMVAKVRNVVEVTCQRSSVPEKLRDRALAHWYLEELKAVLVGGDAKALEIDPGLRQARWAVRLIKLGLYRPMQEAYRHRQDLTGLRNTLNRLRWTRASRSHG